MIYGIDCAYPPLDRTAQKFFSWGWRFFGGYIGGPRAANKWTNSEFAALARIGFVFLPIYVGRNAPWDEPSAFSYEAGVVDGDEANILTGAAGFNENQPIVLDVEYGTYQANPRGVMDYVDGWCETVHQPGHRTILYSDSATMTDLGSHFDAMWGASWVGNRGHYTTPPWGKFDPAEPPPWDIWQFADNGIGGQVDLNSAIDGFPFAIYTPPV